MTFVGKVLVVVNVVLTIFIAMFAGGVFAVQENWKTKYNDDKAQWETQRTSLDANAKAQSAKITQLTKERDAARQERDRHRSDSDLARRSLAAKQTDLAAKEVQRKQAEKDNELLRNSNRVMTSENQGLRKALKQVHVRLDDRVRELTALKDTNYGLLRERRQIVRKYNEMVNLLIDYRKLFAYYEKPIDLSLVQDRTLKPDPAKGLVTRVSPGGRDRATLVQISIGSDDGVTVGQNFFVYRLTGKGKYLGKVIVRRVWADQAVCELVVDAKAGKIQRGDNVSAKL